MPVACPVCSDKEANGFPAPGDWAGFECRVCGSFALTGTAFRLLQTGQHKEDRYKLSAGIRRGSSSDHRLKLKSEDIEKLIATVAAPSTPLEAIDRLLLLIHRCLTSIMAQAIVNDYDYPLLVARSRSELQAVPKLAYETGLIELSKDADHGVHAWVCGLTLNGWKRVVELRSTGQASNQAFVANRGRAASESPRSVFPPVQFGRPSDPVRCAGGDAAVA